MKNILLFLLIQIFFSCNGQDSKTTETTYSQKLEYGLKGAVKEVIQYTCPVKDGKITTEKSDNVGKSTMTIDKEGNLIEISRSWNFGTPDTTAKFKKEYSGNGKNITVKDNKIQEIKSKTTENIDGKITVGYQIQVMQSFDTYGNPTVIYTYRDINKQKIAGVLYKDYTYY